MATLFEITDATFDQEILRADVPALIDFGAPWCPPCRMIAPDVAKIAESFAGRVRVATCNIDNNPGLAERFSVMSVPMLLMIKDGNVVGQLIGAVPRAKIEELVNKAL